MKIVKRYKVVCRYPKCGKEFIAYRKDKDYHSSTCKFKHWKEYGPFPRKSKEL